jgi:hypothetical protein
MLSPEMIRTLPDLHSTDLPYKASFEGLAAQRSGANNSYVS